MAKLNLRLAAPALLSTALLVAGPATSAAAAGNAPAAHRCVDRNAPGRARGACAAFGAQSSPSVTLGECHYSETWSQDLSWSGFVGAESETPLELTVYDENGEVYNHYEDLTEYNNPEAPGTGELGVLIGHFDENGAIKPEGTWTFVINTDNDGSFSVSMDASATCPSA
jgi:hypothetical protein